MPLAVFGVNQLCQYFICNYLQIWMLLLLASSDMCLVCKFEVANKFL